jgi:hypothetical protein
VEIYEQFQFSAFGVKEGNRVFVCLFVLTSASAPLAPFLLKNHGIWERLVAFCVLSCYYKDFPYCNSVPFEFMSEQG